MRKLVLLVAVVLLALAPMVHAEDQTISVTMDLSRTLPQLVNQGKYHRDYSDIAKLSSVQAKKGTKTLDIHLLHYDREMSTGAVLADMERQGFRPATIQELLWIGIQHPNLQCDFPIVALGTVVELDSYRRVAYLNHIGRDRYLGLGFFVYDEWNVTSRFAAVRLLHSKAEFEDLFPARNPLEIPGYLLKTP